MKNARLRWTALIVVNVLFGCVLSFYRPTGAAPTGKGAPFGNSVEQRNQMVRELREIKALLKEQNALLSEVHKKNLDEDQQK